MTANVSDDVTISVGDMRETGFDGNSKNPEMFARFRVKGAVAYVSVPQGSCGYNKISPALSIRKCKALCKIKAHTAK